MATKFTPQVVKDIQTNMYLVVKGSMARFTNNKNEASPFHNASINNIMKQFSLKNENLEFENVF